MPAACPARILAASALLAIASCSGGGAPSPAPRTARPSVLLVTIDTWRWDHVGVSNQHKVETPNLDRLASSGAYVRRMETTCPLTTPAHASLMTGLLPREHGVRDNEHFRLDPGIETLAQRFKRSGYATGAVVSGAPLRRTYGLDRGFDGYEDSGLGIEGDNAVTPSSRPGSVATDLALGWLRRQPAGAPVLLWVHYYDPHSPYTPPQPYRDRYAASPYAGEVAYVDAQIGRLVDAIREDRGREWIVAATGDHGEGLGDHGERTHGLLLYGSTVDVPFILWSGRGVGTPGPGPFSLIDVAPTLCGLAGISPAFGDGHSIFGPPDGERWLAAESAYPSLAHGLAPAVMLRRDSTVFLDQGSEEIYDLGKDPDESRNLAGTAGSREFLNAAAVARERIFGDRMEAELHAGNLALSGRDREALKGLGYVATTSGASALRRVDLRRFAAELANFQKAREMFSARRFEEALAGYDAFIADYPDSSLAHQERGQVLRSMGRLDDAEKAFSRAVALDPRDPISSLALGNLALARGDFGVAETFFKASIDDEEGQPEAHLNLGLLYLYKLGRPNEAKPHLLRFLELSPDDSEAPEIRRLAGEIPTRPTVQ